MEDFPRLVQERGLIKSALTQFQTFLTTCTTQERAEQLPTRLEKVEPLYERFNEIQDHIDKLEINETETSKQEKEREDFEATYFQLICKAKDIIDRARVITGAGTNAVTDQPGASRVRDAPTNIIVRNEGLGIKLLELMLPKFDGSYEQWLKFRDTFDSVIHQNASLNNIQKFHYLESALAGEAARVIQCLGVSDANYNVAWDELKRRYEDLKLLIYNHTKALFNVPTMIKDSHISLRELMDNMNNHLLSLRTLGEPTDTWDTLIIFMLSSKLDFSTKREWERKSANFRNKPTLKELLDFLNSHCRYLERNAGDKPDNFGKQLMSGESVGKSVKPRVTYRDQARTAHVVTEPITCTLCGGAHHLYSCTEFLKLPVDGRISEVQKRALCFNCLKPNHRNKDCTLGPCRRCSRKHNTLLHKEDVRQLKTTTMDHMKDQGQGREQVAVSMHSARAAAPEVLLSTALVQVIDDGGCKHPCRVLLDSCSQSNFIRQEFCNQAKLTLSPADTAVNGLGQLGTKFKYKTTLTMESRFERYKATISCLVIPRITEDMPNIPLDSLKLKLPKNIVLMDPQYNKPGPIDILIGGELFWQLLSVGQIKLFKEQPSIVLQKTRLGWVMAGPMVIPLNQENRELHRQLTKFWEIEDYTFPKGLNPIDQEDVCKKHFIETTTRDETGRFIVSIPFKDSIKNLGSSESIALRRLYGIERRLKRDPELSASYHQFMDEYQALGHMSLIANEEDEDSTMTPYYLPHHSVTKLSSTSTKVRVVFDASAKTTSGLSLNDTQWTGPTIQDDLISIILRFRKHDYVLTADISKMYRQILITKNQRNYQRILWRADPALPVQKYHLNTVTYGTSSAPFLATRCLLQLALNNEAQHPRASHVIGQDFYVDDLLTGAETVQEVRQLKNELTRLLNSAGLELRKWAANDPRILTIDQDSCKHPLVQIDKDPKTLGLLWEPEQDQLRFSLQMTMDHRVTKRTILSAIAKIFDPLGLIGPITITAKLILQELWQRQTGWDETVHQELYTQWTQWYSELPILNELKIPRKAWDARTVRAQLHGFCDASEKAYGACIYIRSTNAAGHHTVKLLCAKSRVAPLKNLTLPRLELCGAVLLARLGSKLTKNPQILIEQKYFWCDSTIVLHWIAAPSNRWKTFVANRISEIQQRTNRNWHHVSTHDNPADLISRGVEPSKLATNKLWWHGPHWLQQSARSWPTSQLLASNEDMPEERTPHSSLVCAQASEEDWIFKGYSSLTRLTRVTAYCYRFARNTKLAVKVRDLGNLSVKKLGQATTALLKLAQNHDFKVELQELAKNGRVSPSSRLASLSPFMDDSGLIRVGGRLKNAPLDYDQRHPIVLSSKHRLTDLIILSEHLRLLHAGPQMVLASLRTRYWIISGKNAIKGIIRRCVKCFRAKPECVNYQMGDVPVDRVTPVRAFYYSGVDYAGPYYIKDKIRSRTLTKTYMCIFVCFSTKAVQLELARDMSSDAFLNCFRRFTSRRGKCAKLYSDNGTNFVGARNELNELQELLANQAHHEKVANFLAGDNTQWYMIPPHGPNFGGLWESAVRCAKYHLKRVLDNSHLTYEELNIVLIQVEACRNSRPLSPLSDDPHDLSPLTPAHFLIGESLSNLPQRNVVELKPNRLDRYERMQQILQHFWNR